MCGNWEQAFILIRHCHFQPHATSTNKTVKKLVTQPNFIIIRALPLLGIGTFSVYFDFDGVTLL